MLCGRRIFSALPPTHPKQARTLSSATPPSITAQPQNQTNIAGQNATFYVTAVGSGPLGYQWLFNGVDIPSEIGSSYTRSNVQPPDSGAYSVIVTNAYGSVTSPPATLTVEFSLIVITNG